MNPDLLFHFFLRLSFIIFNPKMLLQLLVVVTVIVYVAAGCQVCDYVMVISTVVADLRLG